MSMQGQLRIIVLDASTTSRKILEVILRRDGHQVVSFEDPVDMLRFLLWSGPADLLFLTLDLPRMDGLEVLKYLKGQPRFHAMIPIALLSKSDGVLERIKAQLAGAQLVVIKPLVRQQIVALVSGVPLPECSCPRTDRPMEDPSR